MSHRANYSIWTLDLTTAGFEKIQGPWSVLRFIEAVDGSDVYQPSVVITVRAGDEDEDNFPLRPGQAVLVRNVDMFRVSWAAQAGITVKIGLANKHDDVDWDVDPPVGVASITGTVQTKEIGAATITDTIDKSIAATSSDTILAANLSRQAAIIKNLTANTAAIRIGDAPAATTGHELEPGETIILTTTAAILGFNTHSAAQSVSIIEVVV